MDGVDSSSGILLPFYDHDTKIIVFLAGKVGLLIFCIICKKNVALFCFTSNHYLYK